jgi:hypothetical protein
LIFKLPQLRKFFMTIAEIRAAGHTLTLDGERLLFTPKPQTDSEAKRTLLEALRKYKQELIAQLVAETRYNRPEGSEVHMGAQGLKRPTHKQNDPTHLSQCAGCYEVAPGIHIHPPKGRAL